MNTYEQFDKAFANVSAFVLWDTATNTSIGRIAFKYPKDGAGRLWCYVHLFGSEMVRGYAGGYGYDKRSAACADAVEKIKPLQTDDCWNDVRRQELNVMIATLQSGFKTIGGKDWTDIFHDNGIQVLRGV